MTKFEELGVSQDILKAMEEMGFEDPFPIQEAAIPVLLTGRDVVGQAHTGSGKTAAYAVSMLQDVKPDRTIQGLVLAPTRELAMQITDAMREFGRYTDIRVATIYGGQGMNVQTDALERGVATSISTPLSSVEPLRSTTYGMSCWTRPTPCWTWDS